MPITMPLTMQDMLDLSAMCPAPIICKPPLGYDISLEAPTVNPWKGGEVIDIQIRPGWSPSTRELCGHMTARTTMDGLSSEWVTFGTPSDCMIATPEPGFGLGLLFAFLVLLMIHKLRGA